MQKSLIPDLDAISLNRIAGFDARDGCDGHGDEFYGYKRFWQPNDMLTAHVWDKYGQQIGRSLCQHHVNTVGEHHVNTFGEHHVNTLGGHCVNALGGPRINTHGGVWVNIGIIRINWGQRQQHQDEFGSTLASLGCVQSDFVRGQPVARQADRHTVWYLDTL
jgi:hypothetical protein